MKTYSKINEEIIIEQINKRDRTIISVICDNEKTILSDVKTYSHFWNKVIFNDTYIVAYSRGCFVNPIPLNIEAAYNIKEKRLIELSNETQILLKYMLLLKKEFDLAHVLQTINKENLDIIKEEEKEHLKTYLTAGNKNISQEEVINYILSTYPQLKYYTNLEGPLSVVEYQNIKNDLINVQFYFHIMEQDLELMQPSITQTENNSTDYNQINITEFNHTQKVLRKHKR